MPLPISFHLKTKIARDPDIRQYHPLTRLYSHALLTLQAKALLHFLSRRVLPVPHEEHDVQPPEFVCSWPQPEHGEQVENSRRRPAHLLQST